MWFGHWRLLEWQQGQIDSCCSTLNQKKKRAQICTFCKYWCLANGVPTLTLTLTLRLGRVRASQNLTFDLENDLQSTYCPPRGIQLNIEDTWSIEDVDLKKNDDYRYVIFHTAWYYNHTLPDRSAVHIFENLNFISKIQLMTCSRIP